MSFKKYLQETAMGGSTGAGSIAANPSGDSRAELKSKANVWRDNSSSGKEDEAKYAAMRKQLAKAKAKKKKTGGFKDFILRRNTNEDFDMNDIVSRLKGADTETASDDIGVVSYGVEDDKGNVMRITVRGDQAKDFEETIAKQLADNKDNKKNGINLQGNSLAEILYNLRDKFEIITVDFPIIPKDVVYNADMASKNPENGFAADDDDGVTTGDGFDKSFDEFGGDEDAQAQDQTLDPAAGGGDGSQPELGADDGMGGAATDPSAGVTPELDDPNAPSAEGAADDLNPDLGNGEDDNVEDFGADDVDAGGEESILKSIVSMLKAQANAAEAQAEAAAEEARAKQAEWTAVAADREVNRQEDLARVSAAMQADKKKEKEAKKYADLARYNVGQANKTTTESKSFLLAAVKILKEDQFDNVQTLQKQKLGLQDKYKIVPTDDAETQTYKKQMYQCDLDQLNARIKAAQITQQYNADEAKLQKQNPAATQTPNTNQPPTPQTPQAPTPQQAAAPNVNAAASGLSQ